MIYGVIDKRWGKCLMKVDKYFVSLDPYQYETRTFDKCDSSNSIVSRRETFELNRLIHLPEKALVLELGMGTGRIARSLKLNKYNDLRWH